VNHHLAVVGAGPAGAAAVIAARAAGLRVEWIEAESRPGGQLHRIYSAIDGGRFPDGAHAADDLERRLLASGPAGVRGEPVTGLAAVDDGFEIRFDLRRPNTARAVLIATGLRPRRLDVPGEQEWLGRGVYGSATRERAAVAGRPVVVVGGGDAAFENALLLAEVGSPVTLVVRGVPRAREEFRARVAAQPGIRLERGTRVIAIEGGERVTGVRVARAGGQAVIPAEAVFVKAGAMPNTEWCRATVRCNRAGSVVTGADGATSVAGVWAAGDVTGPATLTIAHAEASAHAAVRAIAAWLGGSAA
jgi:thioredoxin reductase